MNWKLLYNPFERYAGLQAAVYGLAFALLAAVLASLFQTRFDGVLDAHFVPGEVSLSTALLDQLINAIALFVAFYVVAFLAGARHTRPIDIVGTLLLARLPYVLVPLLNITGAFSNAAAQVMEAMQGNPAVPDFSLLLPLIPLILLVLLLFVWMIALFFNAYKVSTHLKGARLVLSFVIALLLAETLSIVMLQWI